jgi:putative RNA 2'-phosphotransferase
MPRVPVDKGERLSKYLSYLLRHNPQLIGLKMDEYGFVSLNELLLTLRRDRTWSWVTGLDIEELHRSSDKRRFEIVGGRIRALCGHTLPSKVPHEEVVPPQILFHGTARKNLQSILKDGLSPMRRQYVHLSTSKQEAENVGRRRDECPAIVRVRALDAYNGGVKFYRAGQVFLSNSIPPAYLVAETP